MPKKKITIDATAATREIADDVMQSPDPIRDVQQESDWMDEDFSGQLAVDVYQSKNSIVIRSTIAGVRPEDIDIAINNDMVTIRGVRQVDDEVSDDQYYYRECYWGGFSRSIILPVDIKADEVRAHMKNGVLTIVLPKAEKVSKVRVVKVQEDE